MIGGGGGGGGGFEGGGFDGGWDTGGWTTGTVGVSVRAITTARPLRATVAVSFENAFAVASSRTSSRAGSRTSVVVTP